MDVVAELERARVEGEADGAGEPDELQRPCPDRSGEAFLRRRRPRK